MPGADWPSIHVSFTLSKITDLIWNQIQSSEDFFKQSTLKLFNIANKYFLIQISRVHHYFIIRKAIKPFRKSIFLSFFFVVVSD